MKTSALYRKGQQKEGQSAVDFYGSLETTMAQAGPGGVPLR